MRMYKSVLVGVVAFLSANAMAQVIYMDTLCKTTCDECAKSNDVMKVTYKADPKTQIVFRSIEGGKKSEYKDADTIDGCKVIDKDNWVCPGGIPRYPDAYKQYAVNGMAFWNDGIPMPELDKKYGQKYSCRYEKTFYGTYKTIEQRKRY